MNNYSLYKNNFELIDIYDIINIIVFIIILIIFQLLKLINDNQKIINNNIKEILTILKTSNNQKDKEVKKQIEEPKMEIKEATILKISNNDTDKEIKKQIEEPNKEIINNHYKKFRKEKLKELRYRYDMTPYQKNKYIKELWENKEENFKNT